MRRKVIDESNAFGNVIFNFIGNRKTQSYINVGEVMLQNLKRIGCNVSDKLNSQLNYFPDFSE